MLLSSCATSILIGRCDQLPITCKFLLWCSLRRGGERGPAGGGGRGGGGGVGGKLLKVDNMQPWELKGMFLRNFDAFSRACDILVSSCVCFVTVMRSIAINLIPAGFPNVTQILGPNDEAMWEANLHSNIQACNMWRNSSSSLDTQKAQTSICLTCKGQTGCDHLTKTLYYFCWLHLYNHLWQSQAEGSEEQSTVAV